MDRLWDLFNFITYYEYKPFIQYKQQVPLHNRKTSMCGNHWSQIWFTRRT